MAKVLTYGLHLPMDQRSGGRGSPRHCFHRTHEVEIMYEVKREATPSEMIALKATSEPMLTRERRMTMAKLIRTEFSGINHLG